MRHARHTLLCLSVIAMMPSIAQDDSPYKQGSVYEVRMVRAEANSLDEYLKQLSTYYVPLMNKAKEQGLIKGFTLLSGDFATPDDFDVMMLVEYESMAMRDPEPAREAKWKALRDAMDASFGGKEKAEAMQAGFQKIRHFRGNKWMRKLELK